MTEQQLKEILKAGYEESFPTLNYNSLVYAIYGNRADVSMGRSRLLTICINSKSNIWIDSAYNVFNTLAAIKKMEELNLI